MAKNIVIYGVGGFGREVAWLIERINKVKFAWNVLGFIDDVKTEMYGKNIDNIKLLGGRDWFATHKEEIYVTCPVGSSKGRRSMYQSLEQYKNVKCATLIDPSVIIGNTSTIGEGSIICYGARITINVSIGKGVAINTGSSVGHDSELSDYCTLFTNVMVSGTAKIGENSEIGSGAFILEYVTVGKDIVVAPLSSVLKDIIDPGVYVGNPARRIK